MTITNFAAGELSQNLKGRVDIAQYYAGAQKLENFDVIPTGGIKRRSGFRRMGQLHGACRLIPFIVDKNTSFILEFIPGTATEKGRVYFWKDGSPLQEYIGSEAQDMYRETPYTSLDEINEIQYAQNYNVMFFTQKNHKPLVCTYIMKDTSFDVSGMNIDYFIDVNLDDDYGIIQIRKASEGLPLDAKDGDYCVYRGHLYYYEGEWKIQGNDPENETGLWKNDDDLLPGESNEGKYPSCVAFYQNRLFFASTKNFPQRVWASAAPDTEGPRYNKMGMYQKYITVNKSVKEPDIHLFTANINTLNIDREHNTTILIGVSQDFTKGLKEASENYYVVNNTYAPAGSNVKVISVSENSITINKALDAEENVNGVVFTLSLWQNPDSAGAGDYEYVVVNSNMTTSDCAFYLEPASDQNDAIKWLAPSNYLCIGTESNVWNIPSGVNALNIAAIMNGRYGSDDIQAHVIDNAIIFFAQGKCGIREYYFNSQNEAFQTNNIAILAEQMLEESPAVDFDFMTNPYNRLIITRLDGTIVTLLYDKNNGVMAWNRMKHGYGLFKSVAVTRGSSFCDLVYASVQEDKAYFLECMDLEEDIQMDSYAPYDPANPRPGTSMEHFIDRRTGEMKVFQGYPFTSTIKSMPIVTQDISMKKRIVNLFIRFRDSYMPVMKTTGLPDEQFTGVTEPFSGIKKIDYPGISDIDVNFELTINNLKPCNILSVDASIAN